MKTSTLGWIIAISLFLAGTASAADAIGSVVAVQGKAIAENEDGKSRDLKLKSEVFLNDRIITGPKTKLQIVFNDDSFISQGENSEMVLDDYVYTPGKKKEVNCAVKLARGLFRVVTGKITELNPERFKVQTRMATIGIRGCDLGFQVLPEEEEIYVFHIPDGRSIAISRGLLLDDGSLLDLDWNRPGALAVVDSSVAVSIRGGAALTERPIALTEARNFLNEVSVIPVSGGDDGGDYGPMADAADIDDPRRMLTVLAEIAVEADLDEELLDGEPQTLNAPLSPTTRPGLNDLPPSGNVGNFDPGAGPSDPPPPPPSDLPPLPPSLLAMGGGPLSDWSWAMWDDGTMDRSGTYISVSDFQAVVDGPVLHNLTGASTSSALVDDGNTLTQLDGSCDLMVQVGQSTAPYWHGTFDVANASGDKLYFESTGTITGGADLQGTRVAYQFEFAGVPYDPSTLSGESFEGKLTGPGSGGAPIKGVVGWYAFEHNSLIRVDGLYGADLHY